MQRISRRIEGCVLSSERALRCHFVSCILLLSVVSTHALENYIEFDKYRFNGKISVSKRGVSAAYSLRGRVATSSTELLVVTENSKGSTVENWHGAPSPQTVSQANIPYPRSASLNSEVALSQFSLRFSYAESVPSNTIMSLDFGIINDRIDAKKYGVYEFPARNCDADHISELTFDIEDMAYFRSNMEVFNAGRKIQWKCGGEKLQFLAYSVFKDLPQFVEYLSKSIDTQIRQALKEKLIPPALSDGLQLNSTGATRADKLEKIKRNLAHFDLHSKNNESFFPREISAIIASGWADPREMTLLLLVLAKREKSS